jgi:hypothetical protein
MGGAPACAALHAVQGTSEKGLGGTMAVSAAVSALLEACCAGGGCGWARAMEGLYMRVILGQNCALLVMDTE